MYVPGSQIRHAYAPATCAYPFLHEQNSCDALPATDVALAWQALHDDAPAPENVLLGQLTHALAALAPAVTEYVPALQFAHVVDVVAPVSSEYVPAMQLTHALAPVVVPMFMLLGYSPELTQTAYRVGDSVTNIISPMLSYFALIIAFFQRYEPKAGLGTLVAVMLPYSATFLIGWSILFAIWLTLGIPVGPDSPLSYPAAD